MNHDMNVVVPDASIFRYDPDAIDHLGKKIIVVPLKALQDLSQTECEQGQMGINSRLACKKLEEYRVRGDIGSGIATKGGGKLYIDHDGEFLEQLPTAVAQDKSSPILSVAKKWQEKNGYTVVLLSRDINMRFMANVSNMAAENYQRDIINSDCVKVTLSDKAINVISELCQDGYLDLSELEEWSSEPLPKFLPNQCCKVFCQDRHLLAIFKAKENKLKLVKKPKDYSGSNSHVKPKNDEQCFAYHMMFDPDIKLVTLMGVAGSGKTLMALLAGLGMLGSDFNQILVWRPTTEIGKSLGSLPGDLSKKFEPWIEPITDSLEFALTTETYKKEVKRTEDKYYVKFKLKKGDLKISPINYVAGVTKRNSFIIIDEAQNINPDDIKKLITRPGDDSKVVLTGDPEQASKKGKKDGLESDDSQKVESVARNGFSHVVERFCGSLLHGHIKLIKCERGKLAEEATERL